MLFALICRDKPDNAPVRQDARPAHLAYFQTLGCVKAGGALLSDDGERVVGSMLIVEADDLQAAHRIADGDPYHAAGVFESVEIRPWRQALGAPLATA